MKTNRMLICFALCLAMLPAGLSMAEDAQKLSPTPVTYSLLVYEHASVPWAEDPIVLKEIFEKTNVKLEVQVVPAADYTNKVNVLLSTNQMPDIVKTTAGGYAFIKSYASSGIFLNLSEYMEFAPNYAALYEANPNTAMYNFEGSTYGFTVIPHETNVQQGPTIVLRTDLLAKNNLPMPATTEELLTTMAKLKELYPETQPWTSRGGTTAVLNRSAFILGAGYNMYYEPELEQWTFGQANETFKVVLDYLQRAYAMGVLDTDYATMNNQLWQEKMNTGESLMYIENPGFSFAMTTNLQVADPEAKLEIIPIPTNTVTGTARAYMYDSPEEMFYLLSADVENPELLVRFFDWCYSPEGTAICNFGKEGVTFEYDENGQPQFLPAFVKEHGNGPSTTYALQSALGGNQQGFAPSYMNTAFDASVNDALGIQDDPILTRYFDLFKTDPGYVPGHIKPPFTEAENETIADILTPIDTYLAAEYDKFIMGEKQIDEWDAVMQKLVEMDIQKVIDIYNAAYARSLGN